MAVAGDDYLFRVGVHLVVGWWEKGKRLRMNDKEKGTRKRMNAVQVFVNDIFRRSG